MKLVLGGDNHGIEEPPVGSCVQGISQGDSGAELNGVDYQAKVLHTHANLVRIISNKTKKEGNFLPQSICQLSQIL